MSTAKPEWYRFRDAIERADFERASVQLERQPSLLKERNGIGETVLHFFAVENNRTAVEWLHTRGADLNSTNTFGNPLLFEVAQLGYRELFLWLIEHGTDLRKTDSYGQRIEEYLVEYGKSEMIEFIKEHVRL